ncbi:hypothetical protein ACHAWU_005565 [Discostella pseudostelligera]|uniref:BTB domain-containing protein n=1 Tax=Discostella pseudostelligera TaxID=259834 RepID=A0ABD3NAJ5_9STRA
MSADSIHSKSIHVGTPPSGFQDWERTHLFFHDFAALKPGGVVDDDHLSLGRPFQVELWPFGDDDDAESDEFAIYLTSWSNDNAQIEFCFAIKDANDNTAESSPTASVRIKPGRTEGYTFSRETALNNLVNGALVIEVKIKLSTHPARPYIPENPSRCRTIEALFTDDEFTDVVFEVERIQANGKPRKPACFKAHSLILSMVSPLLAEMCKSESTVRIPNATPKAFHSLLSYIYGVELPYCRMDASHIKDIIEAANRYDVINLKLEAEARYVSAINITVENMMEHLHFADSINCDLLKECVMDFIVQNKNEIFAKKTLLGVPEGLINDLLAAMMRSGKESEANEGADENYNAMCISTLRRRADWLGYDVDGSRETLISTLAPRRD